MTGEELFLSELKLIERVTAWVCSRRGLRGADAEDFASTVKLRLVENEYEVLGRFEGRSSLKTYLVAVINRLYLDHQIQRFGKWRPSAQARRLGPTAVRLESLLCRDGLSLDEACGVLETSGAASREELQALSERLPHHTRAAANPSSDAEPVEPGPGPADTVERAERQIVAEKTLLVLGKALGKLQPRDRLLLRMHVEGELSMADVAKALGEDQKALYKRRDSLFKSLRQELEANGVRQSDVSDLLSALDWEAALTKETAWELWS